MFIVNYSLLMQSFRIINVESGKAFTIGRKSDNSLVLDNLMVSRYHAVIQKEDPTQDGCNKWMLTSLTGNSVTQVNGKSIPEGHDNSTEIQDGDVILIGPIQLRSTLRGDKLSLLVMDSVDTDLVQSWPLNSQWKTLDDEGGHINLPQGTCARLTEISGENGEKILVAQVSFKEKVVSPQGKQKKIVSLQKGESIRLPGCKIQFDITGGEGEITSKNQPYGFSVKAAGLDVFAGKKQLLTNINFQLPAGEILAIIGRSGQGKSTLLRLLQGINRSGEKSAVSIGGLDYRNEEIRKHIAFLEQDPELRKDLTVKETLLDGGRISMNRHEYKAGVQGRLEKFGELFGLSGRIDNAVRTLSGGEMRRVALARELMGNPGLIILDEPLSGLDPYNSKILCTHLKQLAFLGHTVILTTHSYEALEIADKVLVIHNGEQAFYGQPRECYSFFNTRDPEEILSGLNQDSSTLWLEHTRKNTLRLDTPHQGNNGNFYFTKTRLSPTFLYKVGLTAKQWFRDKGKFTALLLQPLVIGFLFSQIFSDLSSLWIVSFALILSANWLALSLSIREIVQEKEILLNEFRKGVPVVTTLCAKLFLPMVVAWIQTLVVFAFVNFRMTLHVPVPLLLLTLLTMVIPPITVGLAVSAFSRNAGQANALLPLLIIPQVALAGALVPLDQMLPIGRALSYVIWSRYNQSSLTHLLLDQQDPIENTLLALAIALGFYIVMVIKIFSIKKAK